MKAYKTVLLLLVAVAFMSVLAPAVMAQGELGDSITVTIDRKTKPNVVLHPELWGAKPETVTVYNYVIRNYYGTPVDAVIVQTASGRTEIPIGDVREIKTNGCIRRYTNEIAYINSVIDADIVLNDGTQLSVVMNADLGTIEGDTELGQFFLKDPHTIKHLVFNRVEQVAEAPVEAFVEAVEEVMVAEATMIDSDGDGVLDDRDKCPNTPAGVRVDANGCPLDSGKEASVNPVGSWAIKGIRFDYNKWDIKPEYVGVLDENVTVLEMNPTFTIEIQGHTDSIASEEYNQGLSEKRAESVKGYFVSKGISEGRIATRGFGKLRPIASNDTPEGRAQNRRIEIEVTSR